MRFEEFEAVSPGIFGVEAANTGNGSIVDEFDAAGEKGLAQIREITHGEGRMSLFGGTEVTLDPDVKLLRAALEPASAASAEGLGLFNFG